MAINHQKPCSILVFVCSTIASLFASHSLCSSFKNGGGYFEFGVATWYGDPRGTGSGGAYGWGNDSVQSPPFSGMTAAGNDRIYLKGKGCGDCYQIKCNREPYCTTNPITVTIIHECLGSGCNYFPFIFNLSGIAFGAMANPGQADNLRDLGSVDILLRRMPCYYGRTKIAFKINAKTNSNLFPAAIEYEDRDGGLKSVEIVQAGNQQFIQMKNIWGAVWQADVNSNFHAPFSFRLTSPTEKVMVATNVVPLGFVPGRTYYSNINF